MRGELSLKISSILNDLPFTKEAEVVYVLLETRKLLEREGNTLYPVLKFYCNWVCHPNIHSTPAEILQIFSGISVEIENHFRDASTKTSMSTLDEFTSMSILRREFQAFCQQYGITTNALDDGSNWVSFVNLLIQILIDQPIQPTYGPISNFAFYQAPPRQINGMAILRSPVNGRKNYLFHYLFS